MESDERGTGATGTGRGRRHAGGSWRDRFGPLPRALAAAAGVVVIALAGSYLVPGGGLRFDNEPPAAEGWRSIPWDACGSVRTLGELAEADLDDEALCAALLKARSHSGGDDDFYVLAGEVSPDKVRSALGDDDRSLDAAAEAGTALHLVLVRTSGDRFRTALPREASEDAERVDAMAIWYPEGQRPDEVGTALLSSTSTSYPVLERLISH